MEQWIIKQSPTIAFCVGVIATVIVAVLSFVVESSARGLPKPG